MTPYSVQARDQTFVKGYGFFSFVRNIGKNIGKSMSGKYSQKRLGHAKKSATVALKTASKREVKIQRRNWWFDW